VEYPLFENEPLQGTEFAEKRTRGKKSKLKGVIYADLV
jgi:hypothetical protein